MIRFWTDGCCLVNPGGPGGWAWVAEEGGEMFATASEGIDRTTNNIMELSAVIDALASPIAAPEGTITVVSDSRYVVDGITTWIHAWKASNWRRGRKPGRPVANEALWKRLDQLVNEHVVLFEWVRGHNGAKFNEMADELAARAARAVQGGESIV